MPKSSLPDYQGSFSLLYIDSNCPFLITHSILCLVWTYLPSCFQHTKLCETNKKTNAEIISSKLKISTICYYCLNSRRNISRRENENQCSANHHRQTLRQAGFPSITLDSNCKPLPPLWAAQRGQKRRDNHHLPVDFPISVDFVNFFSKFFSKNTLLLFTNPRNTTQ